MLGIPHAKAIPVKKDRTASKSPTKSAFPGSRADILYSMQAEICQVLAHPRRIQILDLLGEGEKSTAELLRATKTSKVNLSQHMALLKRAGLVDSVRRGRETSFRLGLGEIKDACRLIREVLVARLQQGSKLARSLRHGEPETLTSRSLGDRANP